jgi:hypothetical protein
VVISDTDRLAIQNKLADEQIFLIVNGLDLPNDLYLFTGDQSLPNIWCEVRTNTCVDHTLRSTEHDVQPR